MSVTVAVYDYIFIVCRTEVNKCRWSLPSIGLRLMGSDESDGPLITSTVNIFGGAYTFLLNFGLGFFS